MKIRNGFVSNSSSSSFVILGVKRETADEDNENYGHGIRTLYVEGGKYDYITGIVIADGSDYDFPDKEYTFEKIQEYSKIIAEELKVDPSEVSLITGVRPC